MTVMDVKIKISDEIMRSLQQEAERRHISLDAVISAVLEDYFDEPTEEEILQRLKRSMQQALVGDSRPAHDVLDEIEYEMGVDANKG